jgi:hypothetical protein
MTNPTKTKKTVPADILQVQDFLENLQDDLSDVMAMEVEEWFDELLDVVADWNEAESEPDWDNLRNWLNRICSDDGMPSLFPKPTRVVAEQAAAPAYQSQSVGVTGKKGDAYDYLPAGLPLPPLYTNEGNPNPMVLVKLFTPDSSWIWYLMEYDGDDTLFGLVVGLDTEFGYISLSELKSVTGPLGLKIERDLWFKPKPVRDLPEYQAKWSKGGPYPGS